MSAAIASPSEPSRFVTGTRTWSKNSSDVSEERGPSLSRLRPCRKPARSPSTRMRLMPRDPPSGLVRVTTMTRSHIWPLEMKVFWDIFVTLANRARTNARQIAAGPGLGHGNRAHGLARDHARQPRLLLFL